MSVGSMCNDCMARVPYATLIATIMCCLGVGIFCGTMYRGVTLGSLMMDQVSCDYNPIIMFFLYTLYI